MARTSRMMIQNNLSTRKGNRKMTEAQVKSGPLFTRTASSGEGGIRTPGTLFRHAGFQDRCIRPLCHLSGMA